MPGDEPGLLDGEDLDACQGMSLVFWKDEPGLSEFRSRVSE